MSYVANNHLNNLYVLSNALEKNPNLINIGPTSILESRVHKTVEQALIREIGQVVQGLTITYYTEIKK